MFCRKCGQELPDGSLFCNKCGHEVKLKGDEDEDKGFLSRNSKVDTSKEQQEFHTMEVKDEQTDKKKKYPFKVIIISAILGILFFGAIWYNYHVDSCFNEARRLYLSEEYLDAYIKVDGLLYFGERKKEVDKIKLGGYVGHEYQSYKNKINPKYEWSIVNYGEAIKSLFEGLGWCNTWEDIVDENWKKDYINDFKEKYYLELYNEFDISRSTVDKILELDSDEKEEEITLLGNKVKKEKEELESNRRNPIEFKNLEWDSNSSYTIATGQVYNKSDKTIKFVTIKVAFEDKNGKVIDTDSTYAVGSEGLAPGESTKWRASVKRDNNIRSYTVSLIDFKY